MPCPTLCSQVDGGQASATTVRSLCRRVGLHETSCSKTPPLDLRVSLLGLDQNQCHAATTSSSDALLTSAFFASLTRKYAAAVLQSVSHGKHVILRPWSCPAHIDVVYTRLAAHHDASGAHTGMHIQSSITPMSTCDDSSYCCDCHLVG